MTINVFLLSHTFVISGKYFEFAILNAALPIIGPANHPAAPQLIKPKPSTINGSIPQII